MNHYKSKTEPMDVPILGHISDIVADFSIESGVFEFYIYYAVYKQYVKINDKNDVSKITYNVLLKGHDSMTVGTAFYCDIRDYAYYILHRENLENSLPLSEKDRKNVKRLLKRKFGHLKEDFVLIM